MWDDLRGRLRPEPDLYTTGVVVSPTADTMETAVQPLIGLALIIMSVISVDPLGSSGEGLFGVVLLVVNSCLMLSRTVPDRLIPDTWRLVLALFAAVASGVLFGFAPASWGISFAIVIAVHAGIRFEARLAVAIAALIGISAVVTLAMLGGAPWWVGATPVFAVVFGMLRRDRATTLRAAHDLIEQTQIATRSQARASTLAERARVARDIHDVLAHSLSGVNMQLSMADALFEAGQDDRGREAVRRAQTLVVDGLGEARRAVSALRDETIDLEPTLRAMLAGEHERLEVVGTPVHLDTSRTQTLVRTAQEALTNARRHAPEADVVMSMTWSATGDQVVLLVTNAASDVPPSGSGSGLGLVGMRERAALVGGSVTAGPTAHGGWQTQVSVPCESRSPTESEDA